MKIAIVTDTHFGARSDSHILSKYFRLFFETVFFPTLEKEKIDTIVHMGDVFDRRKYINFVTLHDDLDFYFNEIDKRKLIHHIIIGNHDSSYRNTLEVNSPRLLVSHYKNTTIYEEATELCLDKTNVVFCPWICDSNREQALKLIDSTKARFLFGHLELKGFEMHRGLIAEHGMDKALFSKFDKTFSGHFHKKSNQGNVYYLGSPYEMTWIDYGDKKGFHLFDTDSGRLEFIENPYNLFHRITYDDTNLRDADIAAIKRNPDLYTDKYLKLVVVKKKNPYMFDKFVTQVNEMKPANLVILEEKQMTVDDEEMQNLQVDDTPTILKKYVEALEDKSVDKKKLISLFSSLYQEANELDVDG